MRRPSYIRLMCSAPTGAPHNLPVGLSPGHVPGFFLPGSHGSCAANFPIQPCFRAKAAFNSYSNLSSAR